MKPNISSRLRKLSFFMHVDVFVDFFSNNEVRVSKTMFLVKNLDSDTMSQLVDEGWDSKNVGNLVANICWVLKTLYLVFHIIDGVKSKNLLLP